MKHSQKSPFGLFCHSTYYVVWLLFYCIPIGLVADGPIQFAPSQ